MREQKSVLISVTLFGCLRRMMEALKGSVAFCFYHKPNCLNESAEALKRNQQNQLNHAILFFSVSG